MISKRHTSALLLLCAAGRIQMNSAFTIQRSSEARIPASVEMRTVVGQENSVRRSSCLHMSNSAEDEAKRLLEQAAKLRMQLADLEGKTVEEVEQEAKDEKIMKAKRRAEAEEKTRKRNEEDSVTRRSSTRESQLLYVPETADDQKLQAAQAIERAFKDGITRQTVRLALVKKDKPISGEEEEWPGGAKEIYREAGRPLTEALLGEVRALAKNLETEEERNSGKGSFPPKVKAQDIWDFDGSALVSAEAAAGPSGDVQALVFPNTDVKYLNDIEKIHKDLGKDRLFMLINPFWRNVESWGFNILAPNGKKRAQKTIFECEGGCFEETYVLSRFSARGEDCVALKAYPYDWQLFAYIEDESYGVPMLTAVRLGSSQEPPTSAMFTQLLNERPEFKMNKTMRQLNKIL